MFYVFCNNNSNNNNTEQFKDWGFRGKKIFGPARCSHLFLNIPVATGSWLSFLRDVFLSLLCSATGQFPVRPLCLEGMWICAWICAYLEGEALLGLSGKKGSCLPRLCILGRPSFEFSGSSEISKITAQVLLAIQVLWGSTVYLGSHFHSVAVVIIPYYLISKFKCQRRCENCFFSIFSCFLQKVGSEQSHPSILFDIKLNKHFVLVILY